MEGEADEERRPARSAAERFAELDEREPEPQPPPPPRPSRPAGRYTWVVGIAFVLALKGRAKLRRRSTTIRSAEAMPCLLIPGKMPDGYAPGSWRYPGW